MKCIRSVRWVIYKSNDIFQLVIFSTTRHYSMDQIEAVYDFGGCPVYMLKSVGESLHQYQRNIAKAMIQEMLDTVSPLDDGVEVKFFCRLEDFHCIIKLCLDYAIYNSFVVTNLEVIFI